MRRAGPRAVRRSGRLGGQPTGAPRPAVLAIAGLNAAWVVASLALLLAGPVAPTALGSAVVIAQGLVIGTFAALQATGLRRGRVAA